MKNENTNPTSVKKVESENTQSAVVNFQQSFEQRKEYFREKERKVQLLESLEQNIDTLQCVRHDNASRNESSNLFDEPNPQQCFILEQLDEYNRTDKLFKVTNPALIDEVLHLLVSKMKERAEILKVDILA